MIKRDKGNKNRYLLLIIIALGMGTFALPMTASAEVDMGWLNGFFDMFNTAFENLATFLANAFGGLFESIQSWLNPVLEWLGGKLHDIGQALGSIVQSLTGSLQNFFDAIKSFLSTIFKPFLDFIYGFLYLIAQIFIIIKLIIVLIAHTFQLIIALAVGFLNTLTSLTSWSQSSEYFLVPDSYMQGFSFVIDMIGSTGINLIAGIAAVGVWLITAHAAIRIASGGASK